MKKTTKYRPFPSIDLADREWPNRRITKPPIWCSVDLRDGNQALATPMNVEKKKCLFASLIGCGFKEIEVGFPSASPTEFAFVREIIEGGHIPDDVTIQVLVQSRADLIERTVSALAGVRRAIIHLYNSTSPAQRRIVFGLDKAGVVAIAVRGAELVRNLAQKLSPTEVILEYSPESFSATEVYFSVEVCQAVMEVWQPTPARKIIFNLPNTVEVAMPNIYADQVEYFCRKVGRRDSVIVSLHSHNDRGTAVAASELGLLAGADRVEGTLFGNGERTGNLDLVTMALNMFTQGVDPQLDFSSLNGLRDTYEACTDMAVPPRQPYSGELVFTAFSGSHQDAIRKGLADRAAAEGRGENPVWEVPYIPIDPADLGRKYEGVIRVNGQSGKAGVAHLLETNFGFILPKEMQREFGPLAGAKIDGLGREVRSDEIMEMFVKEYLRGSAPFLFIDLQVENKTGATLARAKIKYNGRAMELAGRGNGPIAAFMNALAAVGVNGVSVADYHEHALSSGSDAKAIAYVLLTSKSESAWGAGIDANIEFASAKAVLSALNRLHL